MDTKQSQTVVCHGETFRLYLDEERIQARVRELGAQLTRDYAGRDPVFVGVLTGAWMFLADLVRAVDLESTVDFTKLSSYGKDKVSSGHVKELLGIGTDLRGRHVIIVDDIVDTGLSIQYLLDRIEEHAPASLRVAALLHKHEATVASVPLDYVGFRIPNLFVIGYGLDCNQAGRCLRGIYILDKDGAGVAAPA